MWGGTPKKKPSYRGTVLWLSVFQSTMKRAVSSPVKQALRHVLQGHGSLGSGRPHLGQVVCRRLHLSQDGIATVPKFTNCTTVSARSLSSGQVVSPADIRSHLPDLDIPVLSLQEFIFPRCDMFKDKVAVSDHITGRKYTYRELKKYAIRVASALHRQGFRKGDIITPFTINLPEFSILTLAAACLGVIISPANPAYKAAELSHILTSSGSSAIFTIPQLMPEVNDAIHDPDLPHNVKAVFTFGHAEPGCQFFNVLMEDDGKAFPENVDVDPMRDILVLPYSSGTTGMPKGVMLSHYNVVANILQFRELLAVTPEDTTLGLLPFFHIYGFVPIQFGSIYDGAHLVTVPRFEPHLFLNTIQEEKISVLHAVPPIVLFLAKQPMVDEFDLTSIRFMVSGAAPLGTSLTAECQERLGVSIYQGYGLTETSPVISVDCSPGHPGTIGHLLPNTHAKLVDPETGKPVGVGEMGEFCMQGPQKMMGYYHNQQATDHMIDSQGWLHTGDLGYMREDGFVVIEDRLKELIKYKGFQVPPAELESLLLTHPAVQDVGVIGVPSEEVGELPRAYVVLKPDMAATETDIVSFVEQKVSSGKWLRGGVEFVEEIPKSPSGKILRRVLKARALQTN
ncbi:putative 4-coumarate--CoA ligase 1 [Babylonia areolata]|uniref:putative 4-coumarate--CoA ligase 1 n=1 Tax=Babylonia areolata TaxID=304850 RepID=UPI003FD48646